MPRHPNTLRLFAVMDTHQLSRADVADLLGCNVRTVYCWRCESPRAISDKELERLELKLQVAALRRRVAYLEADIAAPVQPRAAGVKHA